MGPALKDAAAKLKGKIDAAALAAKLGKGDGHPPIAGSADELAKAADWVLSLAPAAGGAAKSAEAKPAAKGNTDAIALADKAGCMGCHAVDEKKMGPALKEAGHAWHGKADALAAKLKAGTGHPADRRLRRRSEEDRRLGRIDVVPTADGGAGCQQPRRHCVV